jgi:hypothetical protein
MHGDDFIGLIFSLLILSVGILIFYSLFLRYRKRDLQHKERLAALEKGMPLPELQEDRPAWSPRPYLLRGMLWLFSGIAIVVFLGAIAASTRRVPRLEDRLWRAQDLKNRGATEEQIKQVVNDETLENGMPGAVALLGLVPIGVGLAYLIFYRVESKHFAGRPHES